MGREKEGKERRERKRERGWSKESFQGIPKACKEREAFDTAISSTP